MLSHLRANTYKASLPILSKDFYDYRGLQDEALASLLSKHIWKLLKRARHRLPQLTGCEGGLGGVSVLVPADFLNRLSRDIVRMAEGEKHGVRGCTIVITYKEVQESVRVGKIKCDPYLPSTAQLFLTLSRLPGDNSRSTNPIFRILGYGSHKIYISPGYVLEKRKVELTDGHPDEGDVSPEEGLTPAGIYLEKNELHPTGISPEMERFSKEEISKEKLIPEEEVNSNEKVIHNEEIIPTEEVTTAEADLSTQEDIPFNHLPQSPATS